MNNRLINIFFGCAIGFYMFLVCLNNILDYQTNFLFVSMVVKMEDTFSKGTGWRSINNVSFQHLLYLLIIIWELTVAALIILGTMKMIRKRRGSELEFISAKRYVSWGLALGVLLWFTVFITIGGEWFLMWQSKTWNAQNTAFFLTCIFLLFLIYYNQQKG